MLLNFKFKNFRSFRDETIFTMVPTKKKTHGEYIFEKNLSDKKKVKSLPVSVIYGANASGKSNIILAMDLFKKIIVSGSIDEKKSNGAVTALQIIPFIHDKTYYEPVEFEIVFCQNNNIFRYGLKIGRVEFKYKILSEYLYLNDDEIFIRDDEVHMEFKKLKKLNYITDNPEAYYNTVLKSINENQESEQLFLSSGFKIIFNKKIYADIQEWFKNFNIIMDINKIQFGKDQLNSISRSNKNSSKSEREFFKCESINKILKFAEFGNQEIEFAKDDESDEFSVVSLYKIPVKKDIESPYRIKMIVSAEAMESKGTIQLIHLVQPFLDALKNGGIVVLDEMDASLHFEIVVSLVRLFNNIEINKKGAQIIFNTHNPIYLDGELLRHDQIMMVKKRKTDLVSELYSLADYGLRPEEKILKNYLNGKYGALPHMDLEIAFKNILEDGDDILWKDQK